MLIGKSRLSGCYGRRLLIHIAESDKLGWMVLWWNLNYVTKQIDSKRRYQARAKRYLANYGHDHYQLTGAGIGIALGKRSSLGAYFALTLPKLLLDGRQR
jgi:hypothetical protein